MPFEHLGGMQQKQSKRQHEEEETTLDTLEPESSEDKRRKTTLSFDTGTGSGTGSRTESGTQYQPSEYNVDFFLECNQLSNNPGCSGTSQNSSLMEFPHDEQNVLPISDNDSTSLFTADELTAFGLQLQTVDNPQKTMLDLDIKQYENHCCPGTSQDNGIGKDFQYKRGQLIQDSSAVDSLKGITGDDDQYVDRTLEIQETKQTLLTSFVNPATERVISHSSNNLQSTVTTVMIIDKSSIEFPKPIFMEAKIQEISQNGTTVKMPVIEYSSKTSNFIIDEKPSSVFAYNIDSNSEPVPMNRPIAVNVTTASEFKSNTTEGTTDANASYLSADNGGIKEPVLVVNCPSSSAANGTLAPESVEANGIIVPNPVVNEAFKEYKIDGTNQDSKQVVKPAKILFKGIFKNVNMCGKGVGIRDGYTAETLDESRTHALYETLEKMKAQKIIGLKSFDFTLQIKEKLTQDELDKIKEHVLVYVRSYLAGRQKLALAKAKVKELQSLNPEKLKDSIIKEKGKPWKLEVIDVATGTTTYYCFNSTSLTYDLQE